MLPRSRYLTLTLHHMFLVVLLEVRQTLIQIWAWSLRITMVHTRTQASSEITRLVCGSCLMAIYLSLTRVSLLTSQTTRSTSLRSKLTLSTLVTRRYSVQSIQLTSLALQTMPTTSVGSCLRSIPMLQTLPQAR